MYLTTILSFVGVVLFFVLAGCHGENPANEEAKQDDVKPPQRKTDSATKYTRTDADGDPKKKEFNIQPGVGPQNRRGGYLPFEITKVEQNRKLLSKPPWHTSGGDWTFLKCRTSAPQSVKFLVAVKNKPKAKGQFLGWGDAALMAESPSSSDKLVSVFARVFKQPEPKRRNGKPVGQIQMRTAVLGTNLRRAEGGGFVSGAGGWTATKWFLHESPFAAEVFFNFNLQSKRGEFAEKDSEYRRDLLMQLAIGLRDGPLPERTPQNDPTLAASGPTISEWRRLGDSNCDAIVFHPSEEAVVFGCKNEEGGSQMFQASCAEPEKRTIVANFGGNIFAIETVTGSKFKWLVLENQPRSGARYSSNDPKTIWIVDRQNRSKTALHGSWNAKHIGLAEKPTSPDGQFIAVEEWRDRTDKSRRRYRVLHMLRTGTNSSKTAEVCNVSLFLIGWTKSNGHTFATVAAGNRWAQEPQLTYYLFNPETGELNRDLSPEHKLQTNELVSPDGQLIARIHESDRLEIIDAANRKVIKTLKFHQFDRRFGYVDSLRWVNNQYLFFQASRPAFVNTKTMKMNFASPKAVQRSNISLGPRFRWAVGWKDEAYWIGRVSP